MRKRLMMMAMAIAASSGQGLAADLQLSPAPYVQAPVFTEYAWSGPYIGANIGYGGGSQHYDYYVPGDWLYGSDAQRGSGVVGGVQIGYNYSVGSFVVGAEADFDGTSIGGSENLDSRYLYARVGGQLNYFGTVRGRLGFAFQRTLFYATGGFAYGNVTTQVQAPDFGINDSLKQTHMGYALGGGVEVAVTDNIALRVEYLRLQFDNRNMDGGPPWATYTLHLRPTEDVVRAGLDYKFDVFGPAVQPVIARY